MRPHAATCCHMLLKHSDSRRLSDCAITLCRLTAYEVFNGGRPAARSLRVLSSSPSLTERLSLTSFEASARRTTQAMRRSTGTSHEYHTDIPSHLSHRPIYLRPVPSRPVRPHHAPSCPVPFPSHPNPFRPIPPLPTPHLTLTLPCTTPPHPDPTPPDPSRMTHRSPYPFLLSSSHASGSGTSSVSSYSSYLLLRPGWVRNRYSAEHGLPTRPPSYVALTALVLTLSGGMQPSRLNCVIAKQYACTA